MCKKYKLQAKRPWETEFTGYCNTDDYELIKQNIKTIEGLGWQWELSERDPEKEQQFEYGCVVCKDLEVCERNPFGICKNFKRKGVSDERN